MSLSKESTMLLQAVLVNETVPQVLSAPPPPAPPPPLSLTPPPYLNQTATSSVTEIHTSKAAAIALPATLVGMASIAMLFVSMLW